MKRFNVKLFIYLLTGVTLAGVGLFLVHFFQSGRIADALLWQAKHAEENGDLGETARFLRRYLEFQPNDLEERAHLGVTLANPKLSTSLKRSESALFVLEQVVNRQPERHELRRPLVRVALTLNQLDLAAEHLKILEQKFPRDAEVQYLQGQWCEAKKDYKGARDRFQKAIALDPKKSDYRIRLAILLKQQLNQEKEALAVATDALKVAPKNAAVLLTSASLAQSGGRPTEAKEFINRGKKLFPQDANFVKAEAEWYIHQEDPAHAIACLEKGLKTLPADTHEDLLWTLTNLYLDQGNRLKTLPEREASFRKAREEIARIRQAKLLGESVEYLDARLLMGGGDWAQATRLLERLRPRLQRSADLTTQIDLLLGQCYEHLDDPTRRLAAYQRAVAGNPKSVPALLGLAATQWARGQEEQALGNYRKAVPLGMSEKGWVEFTQFLIERNRQRDRPNWDEVYFYLDQAQRVFPDAVDLVLARADVLAAQNKFLTAETVLKQASKKHPERIEYWTGLVLLAEKQGELTQAWKLLEQATAKFQDRVELRLTRARLLVRQHGSAAGRELAALEAPGRFTPEDEDSLLRGLADAYYRINDVKGTTRLLARAAALPANGKDLRLRLRLFDLYLQTENDAGMQQILTQLRDLEGPQGTWWRFGRSSYLIWQAKRDPARKKALLAEARQLLEAVALQRPSWSEVSLARAEIEDLQGDRARAAENYKQALKLGENNQRVIRHLIRRGKALAAQGERSADAEEKLRQAVALAPTAAEAWVSLVQYLAATDQLKAARESTQKFAQLIGPRWVEGRLALGQCYELTGSIPEARRTIEKLLDENPRSVTIARSLAGFYMRVGLTKEAEDLLREFLKPDKKLGPADVAWARRALAVVLADGKSYQRFREALPLVGLAWDERTGKVTEAGAPTSSERDEDQRARARVLASTGSRPLRLQAIAWLKDLRQRGKLQPEDRYLLAQLYDAEGKDAWPECEALLTALAEEFKSNPFYLTRTAATLLDHNQVARAETYIARLAAVEKERSGKQGDSVVLQARALELKGEHDRGLALLKAFAGEKPLRMDHVAAYAGYLARRNRVAEAIDLCEQNWKAAPPEAMGGILVGLLRSASERRTEDLDRAQRLLQATVADQPRSAVLHVQLADLLDLRGKYAEVEQQYRLALAQDRHNAMALNNLAWLLAERKGDADRAAEALKLVEEAIKLRGPRPELLDTRSAAYLALGKPDLAIVDMERATREAPTASRYFHLARALRTARKSVRARQAFQKAKGAGLEARNLHPVERVAYHQIAEEFEQR